MQRSLPRLLVLLATLTAAGFPGAAGSAAVEDLPYPSKGASWVWNAAGLVNAPILLYHHISEPNLSSRYFVSPADFAAQLEFLKREGYTPISLSRLVTALVEGAWLPAKPVVITFDDGYRDVYQNAFPVMQEYGFVGTIFVITEQIGIGGYLTAEQIANLVNAGWELGSHSRTHANLRQPGVLVGDEILNSRMELEAQFAASVATFSYPYGLTSAAIRKLVEDSGYQAAVGLGGSSRHTKKTRYYLSRIEIRNGYDLQKFEELLSPETEATRQTDNLELLDSLTGKKSWQ